MGYPTKLEICQTVGDGVTESEACGYLKETVGAITLRVDILDCDYPVELVSVMVIIKVQGAIRNNGFPTCFIFNLYLENFVRIVPKIKL